MRLHRRGQMTWDPSGLGSGAVPVGVDILTMASAEPAIVKQTTSAFYRV
jgi:hypothetical protein